MSTSYTYRQTVELVRRELDTQKEMVNQGKAMPLNVPLVLGPVGGGKSSIAHDEAERRSMMLAVINSGEASDPTDLTGIPAVADLPNHKARYAEWLLNKYAALACEEPVLLFFDDLDKLKRTIQSALLGVTANRRFKDRSLHPGTLVMGAGNRLDDDILASEISESLRTRMTTIVMEPDIASFAEYARTTGEIHETVLGYLMFRKEHLHQHKNGTNRFPTPRGWWEVSQQFKAYPDVEEKVLGGWKTIVALKCGDHIAPDFWAWYRVIREFDVEALLTRGTYPTGKGDDVRLRQFAAVFAATQHLNRNGVKSQYEQGLRVLANDHLDEEMRVAFVAQLSKASRSAISSKMPDDVANAMMKDIVLVGGKLSFV